jgi:hypothetical protein
MASMASALAAEVRAAMIDQRRLVVVGVHVFIVETHDRLSFLTESQLFNEAI